MQPRVGVDEEQLMFQSVVSLLGTEMKAEERVCSGKPVSRVGTLLGDMRVVAAEARFQINPLKL